MEDILKELKKFENITLEPEKHIYRCGDQILTSVSSIKKRYKKPFNSEFWSQYKAKELGMTQNEVLNMWSKNGKIGTTRGTAIHSYMENLINGLDKDIELDPYILNLDEEELQDYIDSLHHIKKHCDSFLKNHPHLKNIRSEVIVGDLELGVAGTFDQLFLNTNTNKIEIWDWKTDKRFNDTSKYKLVDKMSHLKDCELVLYSFQIHLYRQLIIRNTNLEIDLDNMYLLWLNKDEESYKVFQTLNLENEAKAVLN